jgi:Septum formation
MATLAGVVAIAFALTGCTAASHLAGLTTTPKVGDCWSVSYADSQKYEDWEGTAAVPCSQTHQSYTFAVPQIGKTFTGSWLTAKNTVRSDVDDAAYAACVRQAAIDLPGLQTLGLLRLNYYIPSTSLWNGGARWVRCDITRIKVGSAVRSPTLAALPPKFSTLEESLNTNPKKFDRCEDDVLNNGPDGAQTSFADCTGPSDWSFALAITLPGGSAAAYPGTAALKAIGAKKCAAAVTTGGHDVFAEIPTASSWAKFGDRELDCWVNNN